MSNLIERLRKKGWTEQDIEKAVRIIEQGKNKKPKAFIILDSIMYWLVLFVALIGNFIISIILIPFMLAIQGFRLYAIIIIIGFAFGAFFDLLIRDLENLQNKDLVIAGIFLPLLALINVSLMVKFSNFLQAGLRLSSINHSAIMIAFVYVFAFILPYLIKSIILYTGGRQNIIHKL